MACELNVPGPSLEAIDPIQIGLPCTTIRLHFQGALIAAWTPRQRRKCNPYVEGHNFRSQPFTRTLYIDE